MHVCARHAYQIHIMRYHHFSLCTWTLCNIAQRRQDFGHPTFAAFVDLRAAFDSLSRPALWLLLTRLGISDKIVRLFSIKWYQFIRNDDVRRLTKQPKLTAIIQSRRLTLFGHIMRMDDNADAKRILLASPPADWRRQLGITWLSTVQQDLKQYHLTLPRSCRFGSEPPSVEDDVDVWRYTQS